MAANSPPTQTTSPSGPKSGSNITAGIQLRNGLVALTAIALSVLLFFGLRAQTAVPTLASLAQAAMPLETALTNAKPTLVEFYADWCTSCQAMAPTVAGLERTYGDRVNFVMLNVDNDKWLPEVLAYRVDGIPHFEFLSTTAEAVGSSMGEQPSAVFAANLEALLANEPLPYAQSRGPVSLMKPGLSNTDTPSDPRSHGG